MKDSHDLIRTESVTKVYIGAHGQIALEDIDLAIKDGEFVAVMGPSGSGKTTLLSVIGGLNRPSNGRIIIDGIDIYNLSREKLADFRREYLGFIFQEHQLISYLTAAENVMLPLTITKFPSKKHYSMASEVLDKTGLSGKYDRLPSQLSLGEQERVSIARAIVNEPPIILADEPTGSLDTSTGRDIIGLFNRLNKEDGLTIFMVTHNPENAEAAERIIDLKDGKVEGSRLSEEVVMT